MKRFVDGQEVELDPGAATVTRVGDRLMVRGSEGTHSAAAVRSGDVVLVSYRGRVYEVRQSQNRARRAGARGTGELHAPMPGQIVEVMATEGANVTKGQKLLVLEAMKTQQAFVAPFDGKVSRVAVAKGQQIVEGALLAIVEPSEEK